MRTSWTTAFAVMTREGADALMVLSDPGADGYSVQPSGRPRRYPSGCPRCMTGKCMWRLGA